MYVCFAFVSVHLQNWVAIMKLTRESMANIAIKTPFIKGCLSPLNLFSNSANSFFSSPKISSENTCRKKKGSIVNVASIAGIDGDMAQLEYAASKAALISATTRFAYELSDYGIRVNAVAPGMTNTKMLGEMDDGVTMSYMRHKTMRRKAEPLEIADVCLFLASEMSSYVNAQTIKVDGGGVNFVSTFNRK